MRIKIHVFFVALPWTGKIYSKKFQACRDSRFDGKSINCGRCSLCKMIDTELYSLLMDSETGLFLETNQYLCEACDKELDQNSEALYEYINREQKTLVAFGNTENRDHLQPLVQ